MNITKNPKQLLVVHSLSQSKQEFVNRDIFGGALYMWLGAFEWYFANF